MSIWLTMSNYRKSLKLDTRCWMLDARRRVKSSIEYRESSIENRVSRIVRGYENAKNVKMQIGPTGGFFGFVRCGEGGWS